MQHLSSIQNNEQNADEQGGRLSREVYSILNADEWSSSLPNGTIEYTKT